MYKKIDWQTLILNSWIFSKKVVPTLVICEYFECIKNSFILLVSCIRSKFPSPDGKYTGFKANKKVGGHIRKKKRSWMFSVHVESNFLFFWMTSTWKTVPMSTFSPCNVFQMDFDDELPSSCSQPISFTQSSGEEYLPSSLSLTSSQGSAPQAIVIFFPTSVTFPMSVTKENNYGT
jgi:hypothetical protein